MKVLIIAGHPRKNSFSHALADAYEEGALQAGAQVKMLVVADMQFNPNVQTQPPGLQHHEADVRQAQEYITWADHLVFVYPTWWGTMPALLKGFLDRVFAPGFSFAEREGGSGWVKLLKGKTGQLITTMDTPSWVYRWILKSPGHRALGDATLGFCGVSPVRTLTFSVAKDATPIERQQWLDETRQTGLQLRAGVLSPWNRLWYRTSPWLKALRLQFYPMTFAAYSVGAFAAVRQGHDWHATLFWLGYCWLFLLEVATVFSNDYLDFETDRRNKNFGPFNGGSRVLVEEEIKPSTLKKAAVTAWGLSVIAAGLVLASLSGPISGVLIGMTLFSIVALGYTMAPLRLSYRGLGELDVALTHSIAVIMAGYLLQGGSATDSLPWLLSVPIFLAIFPSIILSGIPDLEADRSARKRTLAVKLGRKGAARLAGAMTALAALAGVLWKERDVVGGAYGVAIYGACLHAALLLVLLHRYTRRPEPPAVINGLMVASLTYLVWFIMIPLLRLG